MRGSARYLSDALSSSSRSASSSRVNIGRSASSIPALRRYEHTAPPAKRDKGKRREDIKYDLGGVGHSIERQAYFARSASGSSSSRIEEAGAEWGLDTEDVAAGIDPGRVVECRR